MVQSHRSVNTRSVVDLLAQDHFQKGAYAHFLKVWVQFTNAQGVLDALLQVAQLVFSVFALREEVDQVEHLRLVHLLVEGEEQVAHIRCIDAQLVGAVRILVFLIVKVEWEALVDDESGDVDVFSHV